MIIIRFHFLVCSLFLSVIVKAYSLNFRPFVNRKDITGIWRLTQKASLIPSTSDAQNKEEILVRLNDDGTFDRYSSEGTDGLNQILRRGGSWEYRDKILLLAPKRPNNADPRKVHDTLLAGQLVIRVSDSLSSSQNLEQNEGEKATKNGDIDVHLSISEGSIEIGKFMYPRKHKAFFEDPILFKKASVGSFSASQILGNLNARLKSEREESKPVAKFHKNDFHGRRFYLTATPHPVHLGYAKQDKRYDENKVLHDVRVLPIHFHGNSTFSALGTEKILRGRYGITGDEKDRLWFQVSLFGAGRSAPGSVFSEGRLLSHDDRRGYIGTIQAYEQKNNSMLFVRGEFYYGTDLKRAIKPNSMGVFTMQEISEIDEVQDYGEESVEEIEGIDDIDDTEFGGEEESFQ